MTDVKYFHDEEHHNLISPRVIVPQLVKIINPKSVIDVGCGIGTFLKVFKENGIDDIYGLYRDWETDRKSTRLNSSHSGESRMPSSA